jgi:hypothetical protein
MYPPVRAAGILVITFHLICNPAAAEQLQKDGCPSPRAHPPGIEWMIQSKEFVELRLQGGVGYEGDQPDARPLPKVSLRALAEDLEAALRRHQRDGKPIDPNAIYFTFHADTAPSREPEVISVPKPDLWCLVQRGDTVLLSDGSDPHITSVFSVNRETRSIFILDPWPERFFMLKGRNVRGYSAELVDFPDLISGGDAQRKLVRIDKDQFLKVAVGIITLDTPSLIDHYFTIIPSHRNAHTCNWLSASPYCTGVMTNLSRSRSKRYVGPFIYHAALARRSRSNTARIDCIWLYC